MSEPIFDLQNPLAKIKSESTKSHRALVDYWELGSGRSFSNLIAMYRESTKNSTELPPTRREETIKLWSAKFQWQARIDCQYKIEDARKVSEEEARRQAENSKFSRARDEQSSKDIAQSLILNDNADKLQAKLDRLIMFPTEKKVQTDEEGKEFEIYPVDPAQLIKLNREIRQTREQVMNMQRVALALPTSYKSQDISGGLDLNIKRIQEMEDEELLKFIQSNIGKVTNEDE